LLACRYRSALQDVIPECIEDEALENSMFFRFPLKVTGGVDAYQHRFARRNIAVRRGVDKLLHRLRGEPDDNFKVAVMLFETTISLPIYPALTDEEHARCVQAAVEIFSSRGSGGRE
jgi:UDP-4-amino-4-deoxy-L-arabinose-oxoglutarate aminotransferase